ncbi:MAG: very short patch repair endonuclease [Acidobacteriaceae bacterium]
MERYLQNILRSSKFIGVEENRSRTMAAVRSKGNRTTELALRMAMVRAGISGWTMHRKDIAGKPDFFFQGRRVAIFVDGCFWHGCQRCGHVPKTRREFWAAKFQRNRAHDLATMATLQKNGVRALRIWEHELKSDEGKAAAVKKIERMLKASRKRRRRPYCQHAFNERNQGRHPRLPYRRTDEIC